MERSLVKGGATLREEEQHVRLSALEQSLTFLTVLHNGQTLAILFRVRQRR